MDAITAPGRHRTHVQKCRPTRTPYSTRVPSRARRSLFLSLSPRIDCESKRHQGKIDFTFVSNMEMNLLSCAGGMNLRAPVLAMTPTSANPEK